MRRGVNRRYRRRGIFLVIGGAFALFLVGSVVYQSATRTPAVSSGAGEEMSGSSSQLHLQEFNRIQVKEGRPVWEIEAKDAKYFAREGLTHVHDAHVTVFRDRRSPVYLDSRLAKLALDGESLRRAELEGAVTVTLSEGRTMRTEQATYDAMEQTVTTPGEVVVSGTGFVVEGVGMKMWVDTERVILLSNVRSSFEQAERSPNMLKR